VQNAAQSSFTTMIDASASQPTEPTQGTKTVGIAQCCLHWNPQDRQRIVTGPWLPFNRCKIGPIICILQQKQQIKVF